MKTRTLALIVVVALVVVAYIFGRNKDDIEPTPTPTASVGQSVTYASARWGISFQYLPSSAMGGAAVLERGDRIFVYPIGTPPERGQFVQVFQKNTAESFEASIRRQVLAGYSSSDCRIELTRSNIYPGGWVAEIGYPPPTNPDDQFWINAPQCNEQYAKTNGLRYFLYDDAHPTKFLFFDIGQYPILGRANTPWQDTIKIQ